MMSLLEEHLEKKNIIEVLMMFSSFGMKHEKSKKSKKNQVKKIIAFN